MRAAQLESQLNDIKSIFGNTNNKEVSAMAEKEKNEYVTKMESLIGFVVYFHFKTYILCGISPMGGMHKTKKRKIDEKEDAMEPEKKTQKPRNIIDLTNMSGDEMLMVLNQKKDELINKKNKYLRVLQVNILSLEFLPEIGDAR